MTLSCFGLNHLLHKDKEKLNPLRNLHCAKAELVLISKSQMYSLVWCGNSFLGCVFHKYPPSVTAFLETDDLKAIILYLGYQRMEKSGK